MDTDPDPRPDLTAAQRIAIALGTAEAPPTDSPTVLPAPVAGVPDLPAAPPA